MRARAKHAVLSDAVCDNQGTGPARPAIFGKVNINTDINMNMNHSSFSSPSISRWFRRSSLLAAALVLPVLMGATPVSGQDSTNAPSEAQATAPKGGFTEIKGTCTFRGNKSDWSGKLTLTTNGTYTASYIAAWGGKKAMTYEGTVQSDFKTEISGMGKSTGGGGNGTFEFSGKFGPDGTANCLYKEVGGGRSGTLTVDSWK
jgi:hypothetical protein